ncbi:MAG: energy transducer TonB [Sphingobacteriaceae bacterium]
MIYLLLLVRYLLLPFSLEQEDPKFKGGPNALNNFLENNLVYPEYSRQNCISGTIQVSFQLNEDGSLFNVKIQNGFGIDLDDEALRIVKLTAGKWVVPENYDTSVNLVLPINFKIDDNRCKGIDKNSINAAIQAFKARGNLLKAVTNYYSNKFAGKADTSKEGEVIALKMELGLDASFADSVVKQGIRKFKQGDKVGACEDWLFVRNIGSNKADKLLAQNCN